MSLTCDNCRLSCHADELQADIIQSVTQHLRRSVSKLPMVDIGSLNGQWQPWLKSRWPIWLIAAAGWWQWDTNDRTCLTSSSIPSLLSFVSSSTFAPRASNNKRVHSYITTQPPQPAKQPQPAKPQSSSCSIWNTHISHSPRECAALSWSDLRNF